MRNSGKASGTGSTTRQPPNEALIINGGGINRSNGPLALANEILAANVDSTALNFFGEGSPLYFEIGTSLGSSNYIF